MGQVGSVHAWNLEHSEYIVGGDPRISDSLIGRRNFVFCPLNNARFHRFPAAKFYDIWTQQRRSVSRRKFSEQNFENFSVSGRFSKNAKISHKISTSCDFTACRHNYVMITDRRKFTSKWSLYGMSITVRIDSNSFLWYIIKCSYKKPTHIFGSIRCPILGKPSTPLCRLADRHVRKAGLDWKLNK